MEDKKDIKPIDFTKIVKTLWPHRRKYMIVLPVTLIATYIFMICIPRYYSCTVTLAPEANTPAMSGSLSSLASSFGLGSSLAKMASQDALYAEIYPDVVASKKFIAELMPVNVRTKDGTIACNYYTYLRDHQKAPWWLVIKSKVGELLKPTPKDSYSGKEKLSIFSLTKQQDEVFSSVKSKIRCRYDKKTDIVSIRVLDQDPLVCALIADATCSKLQEFIIDYRTNKTRIDYEYYKKLCEESKAEYDKALDKYASSADAHTNSVLEVYKSRVERLENDMQAKYNIYTAINNQMQTARAKLQEATPAFTIIESASVPVKPAGPQRMIISIAMMILSFFVLSGWLLTKKK
jgi:capsular polysaccharide biosynthesis protein